MTTSTSLHNPATVEYSTYLPPDTFCIIRVYDNDLNSSALFVGKDSESLKALNQLRHAVDEAIKWALED